MPPLRTLAAVVAGFPSQGCQPQQRLSCCSSAALPVLMPAAAAPDDSDGSRAAWELSFLALDPLDPLNPLEKRKTRRRSPLRHVPPEVLRKIAAFAFHAGYY